MKAIRCANLAEARRLMRVLAELEGLPRRGIPGPGRHAPISDTPGPGWTIHAARPVEHPTTRQIALLVPDERLDSLVDVDKRRRLAVADRTVLDAVRADDDLPDDWREEPDEDGARALRYVEVEPEERAASGGRR